MEIVLLRHGETEWSRDRRHTSHTDLPLTPHGREHALLAGRRFADRDLRLVLVSPRARAQETARLAGLGGRAVVDDDLVERGYGDYEGRTADEIREEHPGWDVWQSPIPGGEQLHAAGERADRVISRALGAQGDVAIIAHGHILRILAARWISLPAEAGGALALETGGLCLLGFERERRVIRRWNDTGHLEGHSEID